MYSAIIRLRNRRILELSYAAITNQDVVMSSRSAIMPYS